MGTVTDSAQFDLLNKRIKHLENELRLTRQEKEDAQREYYEVYNQLDMLVKIRTRELEEAREKLETSNHQLKDALHLAQSANKAKSQFFTNVSHDLRTPLNAILGFTQILLDNCADPSSLKYLNQIRSSSENLSELIGDLVHMSKLDTGKVKLEIEECTLPSFISFFKNRCPKRLNDKNTTFHISVPDTQDILALPARQLRRIIFHLLDNAIDHTENGRIDLIVEYIRQDSAHYTIIFIVKDTGSGIDEQALRNIRKAFSSDYEDNPYDLLNLGMGLAFCRLMVHAMNGHVEVDSEKGRGTTVKMTLPDVPVIQKVTTPADRTEERTREKQPLPVLLVIDDTPENILLVRHYYGKLGYMVLGAHNASQAMKKMSEQKPDLILMDLNMPGSDGFETLKRIRTRKCFKSIPVLAYSATPPAEIRQKTEEAGFAAYVTKPIDFKELNRLIDLHTGQAKHIPTDIHEKMGQFTRISTLADRFEQHVSTPLLSEITQTLERLGKIVDDYRDEELTQWYENLQSALKEFDMAGLKAEFNKLTQTFKKVEQP